MLQDKKKNRIMKMAGFYFNILFKFRDIIWQFIIILNELWLFKQNECFSTLQTFKASYRKLYTELVRKTDRIGF